MVIGPAPGSHVDVASTQNGQSSGDSHNGIPPRWAFWAPIIAAGIGGSMIGSLCFMAAYLAQEIAYRVTFGIAAGICLGLPPLLVGLTMRWIWSVLRESLLTDQSEP